MSFIFQPRFSLLKCLIVIYFASFEFDNVYAMRGSRKDKRQREDADDFSKTVEASKKQSEQFIPKFELGTYQNNASAPSMGTAKKFYTYKERLDNLRGAGHAILQAESYEPYKQTQPEQTHDHLKPFQPETDFQTFDLNNMTEWDYLEEREALKNFDFSQHPEFPQYYGRLVNDNTMDPAYYINMFKNSKASGSSSTNPKMDTTPHDSIDKNIATLYEDTKEKANKLVTSFDLAHKKSEDHPNPKH